MARRALCIGINRFSDRDTPRLNGCVNDARSVAELLSEQYGYGRDEVRLLLDDQATKASLLDGLDWLVTGARQGDQLVLFASTHGSHIPDADHDEADDEDEVLIAHDHDWDRSILVDDEIARHIARLPRGAVLATLWDACHSGTMNDLVRDDAPRARGVRRPLAATGYRPGVTDVTGKYLPRPKGYVSRAPAEVHRFLPREAAPATRGAKRAVPPPSVDTLTLGACRDDETAADAKFDGRYAGAFTHGLLTALRESPDATWSQAFERLKREVRRGGFDQTPELRGASALRDVPVFGGRASRGRAVSATPPPAFDLAAHDQRIVQAETTGQWAEAARLLEERGARVGTDEERAYTYEHLVTLCRVKLHDERRAVAAAEKLLAAAPAHADARRYLRAAYQSSGDAAKLSALDAAQPRRGDDLLGVLGAVASAVGQMMATPPAHGGAAKASPRAPSEARCGYCGAPMGAGASRCASCGASE